MLVSKQCRPWTRLEWHGIALIVQGKALSVRFMIQEKQVNIEKEMKTKGHGSHPYNYKVQAREERGKSRR